MKTLACGIGLCSLAVLFWLAGTGVLLSEQSAEPLRIATVDLQQVFEQYRKAAETFATIERQKQQEEQALETLKKEFTELADTLPHLGRESELRKEKAERAIQLKALYEYRIKAWNDQVKKQIDTLQAELYNEIRAEIENVARGKYDIVLKAENGGLDPNDAESIPAGIGRRGILFSSKALEISQIVIQNLNSRYAARHEK